MLPPCLLAYPNSQTCPPPCHLRRFFVGYWKRALSLSYHSTHALNEQFVMSEKIAELWFATSVAFFPFHTLQPVEKWREKGEKGSG